MKRGGLFGVKPKLPIKSKDTLGMIYTPGVGHCCMEIFRNPELAYELTNKGNSMFVLSDGTGFPNYERSTWNTDLAMPYLESKTLYYKQTVDIDCYPVIVDHLKSNGAQDLYDLLYNFSCSYVACELYKVAQDRQDELKKLIAKKPLDLVIILDEQRSFISDKVKALQCCEISENFVVSGVMRALMDLRIFGVVSNDLFGYCLEEVNKKYPVCDSSQYLKILLTINESALKYCQQKLGLNATSQDSHKLKEYLTFGQEVLPSENYLYHDHTNDENAIYLHKRFRGVTHCVPRVRMLDPRHLDHVLSDSKLKEVEDLIRADPDKADYMTCKKNFCAIISNGTAILGLGKIGGLAGMPVMEGKSVLFKEFGAADVMPICFHEMDPPKFVHLVEMISTTFGAINLEDIKAPDCFYIEKTLKETASCPVFHDDQHGTAIVVLAALINSLRLMQDKKANELKVVINGGGAAGLSICQMLLAYGIKYITVCDTKGAIYRSRTENMNEQKHGNHFWSKISNRNCEYHKL
jgi:malic enzyme